MESQRYEGLRKRVYHDKPKASVHGSERRDDCEGLENFEKIISPEKHSQSGTDASTASQVQDAEGRRYDGSFSNV